MNLAFQAVLLLLLLLPGIIFRRSYNKLSEQSVVLESFPSFTSESIKIVTAALLLHALWASGADWLGRHYGDYRIAFYDVLYLVSGGSDKADFTGALHSISAYPYHALVYFITLFIVAWLSGLLLHRLVRRAGLDIRYGWLRFNNEWHYLLNGEIKDFPEHWHIPNAVPIDGAIISAVMEGKDHDYLYVGVLVDYFFDHQGDLDRLVLESVCRRQLSGDRAPGAAAKPYWEDARYYQIDGDYFVLRYADIKNLNVKYLVIEEAVDTRDDDIGYQEDDSEYANIP